MCEPSGGDSRVDMFLKLLNPHSQNLLARAGLKPHSRLVDLGCGIGSMTLWMSQKVNGGGIVFGVDNEARKIDQLQTRLHAQKIRNVVPLHRDAINALEEINSADIVYSRFFLMHLRDRGELLKKIRDVIASGGVAVFEEPIIDASYSHPTSDLWKGAIDIYQSLCIETGVDPNYGKSLVTELKSAGFTIDSALQIQPIISPDFARDYIENALVAHKKDYLNSGILSEESYQSLLNAYKNHDLSKIDYCGFHAVMQVVCSNEIEKLP